MDDATRPLGAIHHYDPVWPELFARERAGLLAALGDRPIDLAHVGSTAVPGLAAIPTIDLALGVADLAAYGPACARALAAAGFRPEPVPLRPEGLALYRPGSRADACCLQLVEADGPAWADLVRFRDHLRAHPRAALAYQQLKHVLRARSADRRAYLDGKAGFVASILLIAGR